MYKLVVLLSLVSVVCARTKHKGLTDTQKDYIHSNLLAYGLQCFEDHPLALIDIVQLRNKKMPDNRNAMCFVACVFKLTGMMDDNGMLDLERTVENAKKVFKNDMERLEKTRQILTKCASVNSKKTSDGTEGCDRAKLAFKCLVENAELYGFDISF